MIKMTFKKIFTGGHKYRFKYRDGSHKDYVFAGDKDNHTIWRAEDGTENNEVVFEGVVDIEEYSNSHR